MSRAIVCLAAIVVVGASVFGCHPPAERVETGRALGASRTDPSHTELSKLAAQRALVPWTWQRAAGSRCPTRARAVGALTYVALAEGREDKAKVVLLVNGVERWTLTLQSPIVAMATTMDGTLLVLLDQPDAAVVEIGDGVVTSRTPISFATRNGIVVGDIAGQGKFAVIRNYYRMSYQAANRSYWTRAVSLVGCYEELVAVSDDAVVINSVPQSQNEETGCVVSQLGVDGARRWTAPIQSGLTNTNMVVSGLALSPSNSVWVAGRVQQFVDPRTLEFGMVTRLSPSGEQEFTYIFEHARVEGLATFDEAAAFLMYAAGPNVALRDRTQAMKLEPGVHLAEIAADGAFSSQPITHPAEETPPGWFSDEGDIPTIWRSGAPPTLLSRSADGYIVRLRTCDVTMIPVVGQ